MNEWRGCAKHQKRRENKARKIQKSTTKRGPITKERRS